MSWERKVLWTNFFISTAIAGTVGYIEGNKETPPPITEGIVFEKRADDGGVDIASGITRAGELKSSGLQGGVAFPLAFAQSISSSRFEVSFAKCPTDKLPAKDDIKKLCKTNTREVSRSGYEKIEVGEHVDFEKVR